MKILYIANERRSAEVAATALRNIAPELAIAWTGHLSAAMRWVHNNRDLAALVVEAEVQNQNCTSFVSQVRSLRLTAPIVLVTLEEVGTPLAALEAGADDYVANQRVLADLSDIVSRAMQRAQATTQPARQPLRLLCIGDGALARECLDIRCSTEITEAGTGSNSMFQPTPSGSPAGLKGQADLRVTPPFLQSDADRLPYLVRLAHDGTILDINTAGLAAFGGRPRRAVVGSSIYAYLSAEHQDAMRSLIRNARPETASTNIELEMVAPDGGGRCTMKARTAQLTQGERDPSILCVFDDVTERQERVLQLGERGSEAHCLAKATERQTLETQLVAARVHSERVQREYAAARQDWEEAREHLQAAAAEAAAANRERLERQVRDALARASETEQRFNVAAAFLREGKTLFRAMMDQERANRDTLTQNLADAQTALRNAERRHASEMTTAAAQLAERQAQHAARLAPSAAARETLAQRLREGEAALERAQQDSASVAAAAAERLTRREAELAATLAEATATQRALELRLADAETARQHAEQRGAVQRLAAAQASQRQTEVELRLAQEVANRDALAQSLADAQKALEEGERWHASEMTRAAARLAEAQAPYKVELAQTAAARDTLAQRLRDAEGALAGAQDSAIVAAAERLTQREAELAAALAEATATRQTIELRLAAAETARQHAEQRASVQRLAAADASQRQSEVERRLAQEVANRDALAQSLADAQAALEEGERRHASEMTRAAARLAEAQAPYKAELAQTAAARDTLAQQLRDAEGTLIQAQRDSAAAAAAAAERLTQGEAELAATLAEATATRQAIEHQLADAKTARQHAEQRASVQRLAAAETLQRQSEVEGRLAQEVANRENLERDLADTRVAGEQAERRFLNEAAAVSQRTREQEALLEERFAREWIDHESMRAEMQEEIRHLQLERDTLQQSLDTSQEQLQRLKSANNEARENLEHARMTSQTELQRLAAEHAVVQQALEQVRTDLEQRLERASSEHVAERAKLETLVTERDTQLKEEAARHSASQQAAKNALTQIEDGLRLAMEVRMSRDRREIEQLQSALKARGQELEAMRSDHEVLRTEVGRVPELQSQLDNSRAENRRQFEDIPVGICRCARDGALKQVNHALVALLGYRTPDELRTVDFATTVFDSADDLRLLIERCLSKGTTESVETTWTRKDNGRLVVRLLALPASSELIEIVVENITNLRAVEEQLRQAQRMEAVGRLASEVAGTCDNLLRDVSRNARQWLATIDCDSAFRHQGELLLQDVTRAAGFLQQLSVYGKKQASALEPSDVNMVLRKMEPVLKRIAGDNIELVLPKTSSPVNVDVEAEHVERVLVNVASYGRVRMPFGGRLTFELATVVVGREFVAKYPNVRQGDHVLITVKEVQAGLPSDSAIRPRTEPAEVTTTRSVSDKLGVDLGVLQGLIRDCGGHLWMKAEPSGEMVLKMRLPQRVGDRPAKSLTGVARSVRERSIGRWLRH